MSAPYLLMQGAPGQALAGAIADAVATYQAQTGQRPACILIPAGYAEAANALCEWDGVPIVESTLVFYRKLARPGVGVWHLGLVLEDAP